MFLNDFFILLFCVSEDLYFNEESHYSEENTSDIEDCHSAILQPFRFEPDQKKIRVVIRAMRKKLKVFHLRSRFIIVWNRKF